MRGQNFKLIYGGDKNVLYTQISSPKGIHPLIPTTQLRKFKNKNFYPEKSFKKHKIYKLPFKNKNK